MHWVPATSAFQQINLVAMPLDSAPDSIQANRMQLLANRSICIANAEQVGIHEPTVGSLPPLLVVEPLRFSRTLRHPDQFQVCE